MNTDRLVNRLNERKIKLWVKQVVYKNINDNLDYINALKKYIKMYDNIDNIEIISYDVSEEKISEYKELLKEV